MLRREIGSMASPFRRGGDRRRFLLGGSVLVRPTTI
jgi:hypothetical protein